MEPSSAVTARDRRRDVVRGATGASVDVTGEFVGSAGWPPLLQPTSTSSADDTSRVVYVVRMVPSADSVAVPRLAPSTISVGASETTGSASSRVLVTLKPPETRETDQSSPCATTSS